MTSYQLLTNRDAQPFRLPIMDGTQIKKLTGLKQPLSKQLYKDKVKTIATFNPLEMLDIFEHGRQIKVIERPVAEEIVNYLKLAAPQLGGGFKFVLPTTQTISTKLLAENTLLNHVGRDVFLAELDCLTALYSDLLGCPSIGVRLEVLNRAMCPKFHVDKTGIRMLCTYVGAGTQWLDDKYADRSRLGMASANLEDSKAGIILDEVGIHQVGAFHLALLKGSLWQGNGMHGVIHRSPTMVSDSHPRVMLAIDAMW